MPNDIIESARNYVAKMDPAVSGSGGHNATFHVASILVNGFGLSLADARPLLQEYNQRCSPPWSERELEHKLQSAEKTNDPKGKGYLRKAKSYVFKGTDNRGNVPKTVPAQISRGPEAVAKTVHAGKPGGKKYSLSEKADLPKPIADGTRELLRAAFEEGESIRIVPACLNAETREIPEGEGVILTREQWLAKLNEPGRNGNPNSIWKSSRRTGIYVAINPLKPGGTKDADVTAYRHVLIESDEKSLPAQWDLIRQSNIPCTAVIHSGGDSIHAWVRVDAADRKEYDERVKILLDHFADYGVDFKNKNPSRLSRLPNCERFSGRQELLALKIGAESFEAWHNSAGQGLPQIVDAADSLQRFESGSIALPEQLVAGLLHRGHKLVLGGGSKTNKTWCLLDLGLSVSHGGQWLGFDCRRSRVLYLNFEIDEAHFLYRLKSVAQGKNVTVDRQWLDLWHLRGHNAPYFDMIPTIINATREREYGLVVLDPLYKLLGAADENKATDITQMLNSLESLALHTKAAVAFGAHFSKGNQAGKESIDRISGSGVFARDPDSIMSLTRHQEENCFTVDFTLRNFPQVPSFVVKWAFPLMHRTELDPTKLKQVNEKKFKPEQVVAALRGKALIYSDFQTLCADVVGMSTTTFDRILKQALKKKLIEKFLDEDEATKYRVSGEVF